jgi:hypothetical protein
MTATGGKLTVAKGTDVLHPVISASSARASRTSLMFSPPSIAARIGPINARRSAGSRCRAIHGQDRSPRAIRAGPLAGRVRWPWGSTLARPSCRVPAAEVRFDRRSDAVRANQKRSPDSSTKANTSPSVASGPEIWPAASKASARREPPVGPRAGFATAASGLDELESAAIAVSIFRRCPQNVDAEFL